MAEHSVLIPDQVLAELMPMLEQDGREISDLVTQALRQYVWQAKEHKIDQEVEAYRAMHGELKQRLLGQYVAIHNGEVVDHDTDRHALSRRVRQKYGNAAVLIIPVEDRPEREFLVLSPRFERGT